MLSRLLSIFFQGYCIRVKHRLDCDPQASLTLSLGWRKPETLPVTLVTLMGRVLQEQPVHAEEAILHHAEGVDLIPGSIALP